MEVRDLNPSRRVWKMPGGDVAHIHSDCQSLDGGAYARRCSQLWGETPVCKQCLGRESRWGRNGRSKTDATRLLEDLTPEDWP